MNKLRPVIFVGAARKEIKSLPEKVQDEMGFALYTIQQGLRPVNVKRMVGFGLGVLEIIEDYYADTYRAVFTVRFDDAVYVLHCFQKKAKHGIQTPTRNIELIRQRIKMAEERHNEQKRKIL